MPITEGYRRQVELLVRAIPYAAEESCFALKGGTAINLFVRNLPRLSVDIDLTYLPLTERDQALEEIHEALTRISKRLREVDRTATVTTSAPRDDKRINKVVVRTQNRTQIKVEVSPVLRGSVYEAEVAQVNERVESEFGYAEISMLSFEDLYAGKIAAALDRQHPRDLFDIHLLLNNEGITENLLSALVVYLASHEKSPGLLLGGRCRDISQVYENNFRGMTEHDVPLESLIDAHAKLKTLILQNMSSAQRECLASFYRRAPKWDLLGFEGIDELPAIRWREQNLGQAGEGTGEEIARQFEALFAYASGSNPMNKRLDVAHNLI